MGAFNEITVYCDNPDCGYFQQRRVVSFPLVGPGMCMRSGVYCACNPDVEMRIDQEG